MILAYQVASPPSMEIPRYGFLAVVSIFISPFMRSTHVVPNLTPALPAILVGLPDRLDCVNETINPQIKRPAPKPITL